MIYIFAHLGKLPQNNQGVSTSDELEARRLTIIVQIEGGAQKCLVDTGSTLSCIRRTTAEKLNLQLFTTKPSLIQYGNGGEQLTTKKAVFNFLY